MHAYLIMAHNNFGILEKLITMLDAPCNDIYIHIDKRVENFNFEHYKKIAKHSRVCFTERIRIVWGDISMVNAEYILLKKAYENPTEYKYYHLISGVDLPLKTAEELADFFDKAYPKEFIHFSKGMNPVEESRIKHYHFFTGRRNIFNRIATKIEQLLQTALRIDRTRGGRIARGSQWFSITDKFAEYLMQNEEKIKKRMKFTFIPDEFFVQCAAVNSEFADNLYVGRFGDSCEQNMRYIDWTRGNPYTFCESDFDEVMNSGNLFARKLTEGNYLPKMIFDAVHDKNCTKNKKNN